MAIPKAIMLISEIFLTRVMRRFLPVLFFVGGRAIELCPNRAISGSWPENGWRQGPPSNANSCRTTTFTVFKGKNLRPR
jgi:hypothetical protein